MRRAKRTRAKISELGAHRLTVHRTPRHIYAQVVTPDGSKVIAAASTVQKAVAGDTKYTGNTDAAALVGKVASTPREFNPHTIRKYVEDNFSISVYTHKYLKKQNQQVLLLLLLIVRVSATTAV